MRTGAIILILFIPFAVISQNTRLLSINSLKVDLAGLTFVPIVIEPYYIRASVESEIQIQSLKRWTSSIEFEAAIYEERFERYIGTRWPGVRSYQSHLAIHLGPRFYMYKFNSNRPANGFFAEPQAKIAYDFATIYPNSTLFPLEYLSGFNLGWRFRLGFQGYLTRRFGFSVSGEMHQRKFIGSGRKQLEVLPEANIVFNFK
jgi:hypothetical protein